VPHTTAVMRLLLVFLEVQVSMVQLNTQLRLKEQAI